jgi:hypothetical protein
MAPNPADPVVIVAKLLALVIGVELAQLLSPHLMILLAGMLGGTFGVMEWRTCSRWEAVGYVAAMTGVSWLFAGVVTVAVAAQFGVDITGIPVTGTALAIAWVGHRWPSVGRWAGGLARKFVEQRVNQP